jgi:aminopeptidase N
LFIPQGIKYGGEQEWEFCWSRYNTTNVPSERRLLLKALGLASDPWLLQRFLQASLDRNLIKPQDLKLVFAVVASNPEGRLLAWRHVRANWRKLQNSLGNSTAALGGLVGTVTSHFSSPYDVEEVAILYIFLVF